MRIPTSLASLTRRVAAFTTLVALVSMPALAQKNLVTNGGFESGNFSGFTVASPSGLTSVGFDNPHTGTYNAVFGSFMGQESISQMITTTPGQTYTVSFFALNTGFAGEGTQNFRVVFGGTQFTPTMTDTYTSSPFTFTGMATGNSTMFQVFGQNSSGLYNLHDISVTAAGTSTVPEPSSLALLGTGLFGLVPMVRRKRK